MDDLISRQAAIDAFTGILQVPDIETGNRVRDFLEVIVGRIKAIPSAQPEQRWIPVSERLPKEGERVLATVNFDDPFVCEIDYWEDARKAESDMEQMNFMESITAWMPMPDPYKEEE